MALHSIARRWAALDTEIRALDRDIKTILDTIAAPLLARHGSATRPPAPSCAPPVTTPTG
jgi:hypothetical protein